MQIPYPHVAARIFNAPLLIHPAKLDAIIAGLGQRLLGAAAPVLTPVAPAPVVHAPTGSLVPEMFSTRKGERAEGRPYRVVDGVAVLNVGGALVHRTKVDADSTLLLGYNDLAADLEHALDNPDVHAILQVYDSPGGEAQGAFEYADRVFQARNRGKRVMAIADGMAASAAYLGGSAAHELAVTATGYVGSIGVVMRHVDFSRALANEGIEVTHIFAGAHKVDGNPFEPLPPAVRKEFQAEIELLYGMFVRAVSTHSGMSTEAVRGTQAAVYMGEAAVKAGLASRVTTTDALISELAATRPRSFQVGQPARATADSKGASMSGTTTQAGNQTPAPGLTQADIDRARAEGVEQGAAAERARASGILTHAEAAGRTALAHQCVATGLSVEQAGVILAAAPRGDVAAAQGAAAGAPFAAAMAAQGNPNVRAGEAADDIAADSPQAVAASWDRAFGLQGGGAPRQVNGAHASALPPGYMTRAR